MPIPFQSVNANYVFALWSQCESYRIAYNTIMDIIMRSALQFTIPKLNF